MSEPCSCIEDFDKILAEKNTRIGITFTLNGKFEPSHFPTIVTEQIEKGRGKPKAIGVIPTFCPFCGVRYRAGETKEQSA